MKSGGELKIRKIAPVMLLGLTLGIGNGLPGDDGSESKKAVMKSYMYIKEDSDRFVGEGIAALKDFDGDPAKAMAAAKEKARGDLGSNVRVEVKSDTSEKIESKDGKVREEIKSESVSHADVALENVKYMEFKDFPEEGQVTVLASLEKEDYRRQLAGKAVAVYAPEWGVKISTGTFYLLQNSKPDDTPQVLGAELVWNSWNFGFDAGSPSAPTTYGMLHLGYDWTPCKTRFQPYLPLRLIYGAIFFNNQDNSVATVQEPGQFFGYGAGLGFRFWPTDSFAIFLQNTWDGAINKSFSSYEGIPVEKGLLYGGEASLGLMWSGF
jgi:hypothetical protein